MDAPSVRQILLRISHGKCSDTGGRGVHPTGHPFCRRQSRIPIFLSSLFALGSRFHELQQAGLDLRTARLQSDTGEMLRREYSRWHFFHIKGNGLSNRPKAGATAP